MTATDDTPQKKERYVDPSYRPGVGMAIFNKQGLLFLGERIDRVGAWQMPQGGIDEGEDVEIAVFREMEEEIGTRKARILAIHDEWIYYDIPHYLAKNLWEGKYRGQRQKWVALEFLGEDGDINLEAYEHPEFGQWQWAAIDDALKLVTPFKREGYEEILRIFRPYAERLSAKK